MSRASSTACSSHPAARLLEASLLFNFLIHAVAMASMALLLMSAMPGGGVADNAQRVAYVANHPWLWRLGWLPWQVTALADLMLAVALVRTSWIPRGPAILTLVVTLAAIVPDQLGQVLWMTRGVRLATAAAQSGDLSAYLAFEGPTFRMVGIFGCIGYLLGALGWTWCFAGAGTWSRRLTWLSVGAWGAFAAAIVIYFLPQHVSPGPFWISAGNALGFVLLQFWLIGVTERVVRRCRPDEVHGRYGPWRHPGRSPVAWGANWLANSRFARALAEWLPAPTLVSDIRDVIYVNYLVEAQRLEPLVPAGLELQRLGPGGRYALFTFLTYRHGHFGPRLFGPLRRLLPSPIQSNWRIHVTDPQSGKRGVYFVSTAISSVPHALAGRLLSEGVPMHVPERAELTCDAGGTFRLSVRPGRGTAPDVDATLKPSDDGSLPAVWTECFGDWTGFLAYCVPQDRAMSCQPWYGRVTRQEIELGIPLESCRRLQGTVASAAARAVVGDAPPVYFHVPAVTFRFEREEYDYRTASVAAPEPARPSAATAAAV
jgi:hypothetical protein